MQYINDNLISHLSMFQNRIFLNVRKRINIVMLY